MVPFPCAAVTPAGGNPVALVNTKAVGVPRAGVTSVGEVARTNPPDPVVVPKVRVTAPVEPELVINAPSPETELTPPEQTEPLSTTFPLASNFAQLLVVVVPVDSWNLVPFP